MQHSQPLTEVVAASCILLSVRMPIKAETLRVARLPTGIADRWLRQHGK